MVQKIFIHHKGALGDILLSLPIIYLLKREGLLHLATQKDVGDFLVQTSLVDETSRADGVLYTSLYFETLDQKLKEFLMQFDKALVFSSRLPSLVAENIKKIIPDTTIIKTIPEGREDFNVTEYRLKQFLNESEEAMLSEQLTSEQVSNILSIPKKNVKEAMDLLCSYGLNQSTPLLIIHIGSGSKQKCWPLENYFLLIETLIAKLNLFIVILTGPVESEKVKNRIKDFIKGKRNIVHISDVELLHIASFLSHAEIYLGNDSGISHLAALLCKKVLIIFGPTNPKIWKPPYNNVVTFTPDIECAPCSDIPLKKCDDLRCLSTIYPFQVFNEIANLLKK
ncbi:MAG: glycosyltransferase family 9 protein [Thermodesulfovibrionales bacterium]|nr:glycosyltransferase family 9 protein [Thermodesulfovibrionales bacterium]